MGSPRLRSDGCWMTGLVGSYGLVSCVCARNGCVRDVLPLLCVCVVCVVRSRFLCEFLASGCFAGFTIGNLRPPAVCVQVRFYSQRFRD